MSLWRYANPAEFMRVTGAALAPLWALTAAVLALGIGWGFFLTPDDYQQGATVKIMFLHVPAALMAIGVMLFMTLICQLEAAPLIRVFSKDVQVIDVGAEYLTIVSWTFPASGVIFVGGSMFQALGHTLPALIASFARIILVGIPAFILAYVPGFQLHWVWYLSVVALIVQLGVNQLLLFREFGRRLTFSPAALS